MKKLLALSLTSLALGAAVAASLGDTHIAAALKKADPDADGTVSMDEAMKFGMSKDIFAKANPDNDGTLDKKEFAAAVKMQFESADPDKDGTLDWNEAQKAGIKDKSAFDAANTDKDATLDLVEFLAAATAQAK